MIEERNYKFKLPNNHTIDIISDVVSGMLSHQQIAVSIPESGGLLLGYVDAKTNNDTISAMTTPQTGDLRTRLFCSLRDGGHYDILKQAMQVKNYFMGTWHTHPQKIPCPSSTDWDDWHKTLSGTAEVVYRYVYYVIIGTENMRIWVGDFKSKSIHELLECKRFGSLYDEQL